MIIGVPTELKTDEYRVSLVPSGAEMLTSAGHSVLVESRAGEGSGFPDELYREAGAEITAQAAEIWARADMVLKVKEPVEREWPQLRGAQVVFTYFHFAASEALTRAVRGSGCVAVAYETVELDNGELPLLTPMSEVAGRMAVQEGARYLERPSGGRGMLLGGVPGVPPADVVILGGGVAGTHAAKMAAGLGAHVTILDISLHRLRYLADVMPANVELVYSTRHDIQREIERADLVIGAVLVTGKKAPILIRREDLKRMKPGSVIVDVAVDQGGCVESIRPTTHEDPTFVVDGVVHYGVANIPGAVPRTSTLALTNATLPYAVALANAGWRAACLRDRALRRGVNMVDGAITYAGVAEAFGFEYRPVEEFLVEEPHSLTR
ncbi:MAG: alanine dehydrogenase [Gemmatimonadetes bacterium]|nr:alanine dehydrogenase [Gemmatimonadota bacterium]